MNKLMICDTHRKRYERFAAKYQLVSMLSFACCIANQESTEREETDEIEVCQIAATAVLFSRLKVRLGIAPATRQRRQHDLLPLLPCCTSWNKWTKKKMFNSYNLVKIIRTANADAHWPEEQKHSHEKGLKVVVPIELSVVIYGYLPKCLETKQRAFNVPEVWSTI